MSTSKPYLFILKSGPVYALDDYISYQITTLSRHFDGELWVHGSTETSARFSSFQANIVQSGATENRLVFVTRYFRRVLRQARITDRTVQGPKVVVTYDPFLNGLLGLMISRILGWPLVVEVNGAYGDADNYADSIGLFGRKIKPILLRAIGRIVIRNAHGVRLLFDEQLSGFARTNRRCIVRRYFDAVPLERFPERAEERFLLHVGFPFFRKGVDLLLAAFGRLSAEFPDWKLILIGYELQNHIPTPPKNVEVLKPMSNVELATWISRCAALVLASRSEAMGRVLIEAAAAGKPRIASRTGGIYTVVTHESDGLMFESGNVDALTEVLRRTMRDQDLRRRLGHAARERALQDFSAQSYLDHVSELVRAVLVAKKKN